jgi:hypothetical protein
VDFDSFPLHKVFDVINQAAGHRYFFTIDLSQAYHRAAVEPESQLLTAFTYQGKQYMFARAPFGLKPLTSVIQRSIFTLLGPLLFCTPYIDDIIGWGDSFDGNLENARALIHVLTRNNFIINRDKCHFLHTHMRC